MRQRKNRANVMQDHAIIRRMSKTLPADTQKPTTAAGQLIRGIKLGFPIFLGYMPVGAVFGIVATESGFTTTQAIVCSATALAGAGQFIALTQMNGGASLVGVLLATTIVNLRYVLFGASIAQHLKGVGTTRQAALAFTLTDETFAVNTNDCRAGSATTWSMFGVGLVAWTGWVLGTAIGAFSRDAIGDPSRWGLEFAMPAMFAALFVALAENRRHLAIGVLAGLIALALPAMSAIGIVVSDTLFIIVPSVLAAFIGAMLFPKEKVR